MIRLSSDNGDAGNRERILVVCKKYVGDTVLAIPFLRNLRQAFPDAVIDVFAEGAARDVLVDCPHLDEIVEWIRPPRSRTLGGRAAGRVFSSLVNIESAAARLRSRGYTRAYLLKNSLSAAVLAARAAIPHRVGFAADMGSPLLSRAVGIRPGRHQVELYLDLLRADGLAVDDGHNENWIAPDVAARVAAVLDRLTADRPRVFVACCATRPTPRWPLDFCRRTTSRVWPLARWAELVAWLIEARGCEVVFSGSRVDMLTHETIRQAVGPQLARHVHDFSATLPLRETAALLARMDLCVGIDTGLAHVAASFGLPVIALFGPSDPNRWAPWTASRAVVRPPLAAPAPREPRLIDPAGRGIHAPPREWGPGPATLEGLDVAAVIDQVAAFLPNDTVIESPADRVAPPADRPTTIDLREGSYRYEVVASPAVPVAESVAAGGIAAVRVD